jgi:hypothetical protein
LGVWLFGVLQIDFRKNFLFLRPKKEWKKFDSKKWIFYANILAFGFGEFYKLIFLILHKNVVGLILNDKNKK